ncbi:MAG: glucose-6-phosphate dehydrogenase [Nitrospirae bacterium]|nr:MAG: glucose-6-phosphate dehydrogenase [Nitrospirota bacterium]
MKRKKTCLIEPVCEPFGLIIFGASGDLTRKKLIPALFSLYLRGMLPERFFILGVSRTAFTDNHFREHLMSTLKDTEGRDEFLKHLYYSPVDYSNTETYRNLKGRLQQIEKKLKTGKRRLFYLAVPPIITEEIVNALGESSLVRNLPEARIIIEKPFGWDLNSAKSLNLALLKYFKEEQVFRIDHYLGKETVQDILLFRFANSIFEPIWNRNHIEHVQITASESIGVGERAGYYDRAGIIRDMFQNHIIQLLSLVTMEPPALFEPKRIRDEKVKVFRSLRPITKKEVSQYTVFGQYVRNVINGEELPGYRDEPGVRKDSKTPTYAAIKVFIDNWRWQGVPFYLRSGKRLSKRITEVSIHFKTVPHSIFKDIVSGEIKPNVLVFRIQPDEAIELTFQTKIPGTKLCFRDVVMNFSYRDYGTELPDAYERVLMDCLRGDHLLFVGQEGVELAWEFFTPMLEFLEKSKRLVLFHIHDYKAGTWGPWEAEEFIKRDGYNWWVR